jgi:hypothetical protein
LEGPHQGNPLLAEKPILLHKCHTWIL